MFLKKQIFIIFIICAVVLSCFSGCTKKPVKGSTTSKISSVTSVSTSGITSQLTSSGSTSSSSTKSGGSSTGSSTTPTTGFKPPIYDLKKAKVNVRVIEDFKTSTSYKTYMQGFADAEKAFNCDIVFSYYSDVISEYNSLVTKYRANQTDYQIFMMRGYNVTPRFSASGVITNLSKYYDYASDPAWQNEYVKNVGVWRGNRYAVSYGDTSPGYCIWYNKSLFAAANVPDPWTYVNNNTWNWTTFRDVCKKLTRDTNGDQKPDVWAFNAEDTISPFIITNGGKVIDTTGPNGKFAADSPQAIEAIEYNKRLFYEDKVIPTSTSGLAPQAFYQMQSGKLAMFPYSVAYGPYLVEHDIPASNLGWVYWPKGDSVKNKDYIIPTASEPVSWVVPTKVANPKEITALITYATAFWSKAKSNSVDILIQNEEVLKDDKYLDILVGNNKKLFSQGAKNNVYLKFFNYEGAQPVILEMLDKILTNQMNTSAALTAYKDKIQSKIANDESSGSLG